MGKRPAGDRFIEKGTKFFERVALRQIKGQEGVRPLCEIREDLLVVRAIFLQKHSFIKRCRSIKSGVNVTDKVTENKATDFLGVHEQFPAFIEEPTHAFEPLPLVANREDELAVRMPSVELPVKQRHRIVRKSLELGYDRVVKVV